ncbi:adenylosuccinate lyase [Parelusimicrobium proximum]|uniref:adenylosuccinate lyase n=1 Tax=Parelusimicrobium proximum TaxID=3228953 RepID=UPI003D177B77
MSKFNTISPLDGRYYSKLAPLAGAMGGAALTNARVFVEVSYFFHLASLKLKNFPAVTAKEAAFLNSLFPLKDSDLQIINDIEFKGYKNIKPTNHDVKAIEYFLADKMAATSLKNRISWIHFALTSEDVNSVSYAILIRDGLERVLIPSLTALQKELSALSVKYSKTVILGRTHGQAAVPTTFGKEFRVFERRLNRQLEQLKKTEISCKFGGAVGSFNAHKASFPSVNWQKSAEKFIAGLNKHHKVKIFLNEVSTQIDPHDTYAEVCDNIRRINTIILDFCQDMWRYISDTWITQRPVDGEVGSSTMPQKVNPIDFEQAEGNIGLANAMLGFFSSKLPVSRLQRDLSDSTVLRNFASAFGYCEVSYKAVMKGLGKIAVNKEAVKEALDSHAEVLAEGVQTILRAEGIADAYEQLKSLTRGKKITKEILKEFIEGLDVNKEAKNKLKGLSVSSYIGESEVLARKK